MYHMVLAYGIFIFGDLQKQPDSSLNTEVSLNIYLLQK